MKKLYLLLAILVQVSVVYSQHFVKGYVGDGFEQMSILILKVEINGTPLQAGDEVAAYDGNLCVGVLVLDAEIDTAVFKPVLSASADDEPDDNGYLNGFQDGRTIYLRFWDSSAGVEYHNVVPVYYDKTTGNPTTPSTFSKGGTCYVTASTTITTLTWVGGNNAGGPQNWDNINNWNPKVIPEPKHDVIIPNVIASRFPSIYPGTKASCGSLSIANNIVLTVWSDDLGDGSLVVASGISGAGTAVVYRYMAPAAWHLVSSPVSESISGFLANNNPIPTKNTDDRGLMTYDESIDDWNAFFTNSSGGSIDRGIGYCVRIDDQFDPTLNNVMFSGSLSNGNVTTSITRNNFGWNLIGNPFSSAIFARQEVFGFLTVNAGALDASHTGVYLWDEGTQNYTVVNSTEGQANLASGQGFFVKAGSGGGSVTFTKTMQVHQTDATFKSALITFPNVVLTAKSGDINSSAKINFIEGMTLGLDPSYDAGILRSGNGFDIYSRLVSDNGVDFAIQALPGKSVGSYVIPIGVDASNGGEIVFSAQALNLPANYDLILEDKLTGAQTNMKNGELYVADIAANSKGVGRFYLHVGSSVQTGLDEIQQNDILVYTIDQTVFIKGTVSNNAQFMVYSIDGRLINRFGATSQNINQMSVAGYSPGVYLLNVRDNNRYKSVKFVIGK